MIGLALFCIAVNILIYIYKFNNQVKLNKSFKQIKQLYDIQQQEWKDFFDNEYEYSLTEIKERQNYIYNKHQEFWNSLLEKYNNEELRKFINDIINSCKEDQRKREYEIDMLLRGEEMAKTSQDSHYYPEVIYREYIEKKEEYLKRQKKQRRQQEEERRRQEEQWRQQKQQRRQEEQRRWQEQQRRQEEERRRQEQQRAYSKPTEADYHKILGTNPTMSFAEIKKAYHKKVMEYHPDKVSQLGEKLKEVAEEEMKKINEAYNYFEKKYQ